MNHIHDILGYSFDGIKPFIIHVKVQFPVEKYSLIFDAS